MQSISGYIERIVYHADESGFTVARLQEPGKRDLTTVVGNMPGVTEGETLRCEGIWKQNPSHGTQFQVEQFECSAPATLVAIEKYLGSRLIKGIGPAYAKRIVDTFGLDTLEVIDKQPGRLTQIPGLGKKRVSQITDCWAEQRSIRDVMIFLQKYGVSPVFAQKIFRAYGDEAIEKVSKNPYALARDIFGIGFRTADRVATEMGVAKDAPQRIEAGIEYVLSELSNDGHVCYPQEPVLEIAYSTLEVPPNAISERIGALVADKRIVCEPMDEEKFLWFKPMHLAEKGIVREVGRLTESLCFLRKIDIPKALKWVQEQLKIDLAPNQADAVAQALTEKLQIITGGPGTGKSTITNAILRITEKLTGKILLAAPTGRAAKRMTEITHRKACTIHSLLDYDFRIGGFKRNGDNPLDCDLIIVDEASMIDTFLMNSLLRALPNRARVIFVGDINQLPSVGPGNVLRDLINSKRVPVTILTEIFRQAKGSQIIANAHRINAGEFPNLKPKENSDFYFIEAEEKEQVLQQIVSLVATRLPKKYGLDRIAQIQVLAPMRRGEIGTENLNVVLQQTLNPSQNPLVMGARTYHLNDKVMQIRNNYTKEVYNGDVGLVTFIDTEEKEVVVTYDGKPVTYTFSELDEVVLAYAVSIHKYQGSECPCVVIPVHTSHFKMLHRNLLYTGVTRGKKLVVLVGTSKAVGIAVRNNEVKTRHTGLLHFLKAETLQYK